MGCDKYPVLHQKVARWLPIDHTDAWRKAAEARLARGEQRAALEALGLLVVLSPDDPSTWQRYGRFCAAVGLPAELRRAAEELRRLGMADAAAELESPAPPVAGPPPLPPAPEAARPIPRPAPAPRPGPGPLADAPVRPSFPGDLIAGRYRVGALLGRGGMGEVWRVVDTLIDETVALKLLLSYGRAGQDRKYFQREVKLARKVAHPCVCRIYEAGTHGTWPFITMELVTGRTLHSHLSRRQSLSWTLGVMRQICDALVAIHAQGIIHRDLKPGNVMLTDGGAVKVMDFGLARQLGPSEAEARATAPFIGTPSYMSPEQLFGSDIDHRTDIYSFGLMAWEMLTGDLPFSGPGHAAVRARLRGTLPAAPPGLPTALVTVIKGCLAPDKEKRVGTIKEVLSVLDAVGLSTGS